MYAIGVDIGGMSVKIGIVDGNGKILYKNRRATADTAEKLVEIAAEQINEILQLDSVSYTYRLRELTNTDNTMSEIANPTLDEPGGMDENSAPVMSDVDALEDPLQEELE